jgi:hypothetical protein
MMGTLYVETYDFTYDVDDVNTYRAFKKAPIAHSLSWPNGLIVDNDHQLY